MFVDRNRLKHDNSKVLKSRFLWFFLQDLTLSDEKSSVVYLGGDALESLGSVVDCVHCRHVGQQGLRCADVTRGLVSADVLLSRLQS